MASLRTGACSECWRRSGSSIRVVDPLPFLDVERPETHEFLSEVLASELVALGYDTPLDLATVAGQDRRLSRLIAEHAYTATEDDGSPTFSGIRYMSRIATGWECWAIFEGTQIELVGQDSITLDDADLQLVADLWSLRVF